MVSLKAIRVFAEVAQQGGFSAASRALNISPPSVTRIVSELEAELGVRLFNRSTRALTLTEEGERFLRGGRTVIDEVDTLTNDIRQRNRQPRGRLRVSSVIAFGQEVIAPLIPGFMEQYPEVEVELDLSNRKVDLIEEHFDLAIRIGGPEGLDTSSLKARKIFSQTLIFVATPEYVQQKGQPRTLNELADHRVVKQISGAWGRTNRLNREGEVVEFSLPERYVVNSPNAARNAVLSQFAIGLLADYLVKDLIAVGKLERILPEYATLEQPIYAVFVHRNYMPAKTRAFIDFLADELPKPNSEAQ
jgi:LysR family transcriptional regulator for bpeEF and oprC